MDQVKHNHQLAIDNSLASGNNKPLDSEPTESSLDLNSLSVPTSPDNLNTWRTLGYTLAGRSRDLFASGNVSSLLDIFISEASHDPSFASSVITSILKDRRSNVGKDQKLVESLLRSVESVLPLASKNDVDLIYEASICWFTRQLAFTPSHRSELSNWSDVLLGLDAKNFIPQVGKELTKRIHNKEFVGYEFLIQTLEKATTTEYHKESATRLLDAFSDGTSLKNEGDRKQIRPIIVSLTTGTLLSLTLAYALNLGISMSSLLFVITCSSGLTYCLSKLRSQKTSCYPSTPQIETFTKQCINARNKNREQLP